MTDNGTSMPGRAVRRMVVATDRTEGSDRTVVFAAQLAGAHDAELIAVQVVCVEDGQDPPDANALEVIRGELLESVRKEYVPCDAIVTTSTRDEIADAIVRTAA